MIRSKSKALDASACAPLHPSSRSFQRESTIKAVAPEDAADIVNSLGNSPVERLVCPDGSALLPAATEGGAGELGDRGPAAYRGVYRARGVSGVDRSPYGDGSRAGHRADHDFGLRGRGGGGYPTGLKWTTVAKSQGDLKYVGGATRTKAIPARSWTARCSRATRTVCSKA